MLESVMRENTSIPKGFPINAFLLPSPLFIPVHWHEHLELVYIINGTAVMQVDAQRWKVSSGDLIFVNTRQIHGTSQESADAQMIAIVFNESLVRNEFLDLIDMSYIIPALTGELALPNKLTRDDIYVEVRQSLDRLLLEFYLGDFGGELIIKSELFKITGLLIKAYARKNNHKHKPALSATETEVMNFIVEMSNSHSWSCSVEHAAQKLNVSISHFHRLFHKLTGTSFGQYRNRLRIQECERLLKDTHMSVTEIAFELGFSNPSHFEKAFKKTKGLSPGKYRMIENGWRS